MLFDLLYFYNPLFTLLVRWRKYTATFKVKKKYFMTHFYQWKVTMTSKCNDIDTYCYLFYIFPTLCYFDCLSFEKSKRCIYLNNKLLSFVIHMGMKVANKAYLVSCIWNKTICNYCNLRSPHESWKNHFIIHIHIFLSVIELTIKMK